jgi:cytochrome c biogenesis protein CcdA
LFQAIYLRKLSLVLLLVIIATAGAYSHVTASPGVGAGSVPQCIYFFYSEGCHSCDSAKAYINQMEQEFPSLNVQRFEVTNTTNLNMMFDLCDCHNVSLCVYPVVFIGNEALVGDGEIQGQLEALLMNNTGWMCPTCNSTIPPYQPSLPLTIVFAMAFADSLNPCAITVLMVLMVALSSASKKVWKTGLAYILGNFVSYLAIGLGLSTILQQFNLPSYTSKAIGVLAIVLAVFSLFSKMPEQSKPTIKKLINTATSPLFAFLVGAAISAIELPCTGGPYFLALGLMRQYNISQIQTLGYLAVYNIIFVLPLVAVLIFFQLAQSPKIPKGFIRWASAILMFAIGIMLILL